MCPHQLWLCAPRSASTVPRSDHALVIDLGQEHSRLDPAQIPNNAAVGAILRRPSRASGRGRNNDYLGRRGVLYQVADQRGISLRWLIERNDFTRRPALETG